MKKLRAIVLAMSSFLALPHLAHSKTFTPAQTGLAMMRLQTTSFSTFTERLPFNSIDRISTDSIWNSLRKNFRMDEVNSSLVRSHENKFINNSAYFNRTLLRSTPYMYHIANEVQKRNMPAEIALLPFIESAFVTKAKSHVGASGLWQFMPATGRHYGLEQTPLYDGRHDVYAATNAALNYLQYLYSLFGDWSLALAAYNWGEGNMSRAVNRAMAAGLPPTYENLRMPAETRNYVPKLLAVRNLVNNPQAFGLKLPEIKSEPYFKAISVHSPMDILAAAHLANISQDEFLALNPAFKTPVFIPKNNNRMLLLPVHAAKTFEANYKDSDPQTLLSWDVYTPDGRVLLADIAAQTGSSVSELQQLNGIRSTYVDAGRSILVNKNRASGIKSVANFAKADFDPIPDTYVEHAPIIQAASLATPAIAPSLTKPVSEPSAQTPIVTPPVQIAFGQPENTAAITTPSQLETTTQNPESVATATISTSEPTMQPENPSNPSEIATTQTPAQSDELMSVVRVAQEQIQAAEAVRQSIAEFEAEEAKTRAAAEKRRQQQLAAEKEKTKPDVATHLAKKNTPAEITSYKVANGDTLYSIAKRHNLDVEDLIASNHLKGNAIHAGQTLKIATKATDTPTTIKVKGNDKKNNDKNDKNDKTDKNKTDKNDKKGTKDKKSDSKNTTPRSYVVRKGDTLQSIAQKYDLKVNDIKRLNNSSKTIKVGQTLKLSSN